MLTRKCDICGAEMRITTPRYKVTFDGWLYTEEKDICIDCFKRIADEIKQADTPQTELTAKCLNCHNAKACKENHWEGCRYEPWKLTAVEADTPQTDCETCKYGQDKHRYAHICNECGVGINNYTPQTETQNSNKNSNLTFEKSDCPWK